MKLFVANKETGMFIEEVATIEKGLELIRKYEESDKAEGTYTSGFYDIVNECHESVLYKI